MNPTVADISPKTLDGAKRQFVELYGSALVMNTYLKIAVVLLALVALGLVALNFRTVATYANVKPLVVRIDDVGRGAKQERVNEARDGGVRTRADADGRHGRGSDEWRTQERSNAVTDVADNALHAAP